MTIPSIEMNMNGFQTAPTPLAGSETTALFAGPQMNSNGGFPVDAASVPLSASVAPETLPSRLPTPALDAAAVSRFREAMEAPLAENARLQGVLNQAVRQIVRQPVDPKFVEALAIAANLAPSDSPKEVVIENGSPVVKDVPHPVVVKDVPRPAVEKDVPHPVDKTSARDVRPDQTVLIAVGVGVLETPHKVGSRVPRDRVDEFSPLPQSIVRAPETGDVGRVAATMSPSVRDVAVTTTPTATVAQPAPVTTPPAEGVVAQSIPVAPPTATVAQPVPVTTPAAEGVVAQPVLVTTPVTEAVVAQPVPEKVPERVERPVQPMAESSKVVAPETVSVASRGEQVIPASVDETEREEEVAQAMVLPSPVLPTPTAENPAVAGETPLTVSPVAVERTLAVRGAEMVVEAAGEIADAILVTPGLLRGQGEIRIQLKPEVLAGTEVRIEVTGRTLSVEFHPVEHDVAVLIDQNLPQLQQQLATRIHAFDIAVAVRSDVSVGRLQRKRDK